MNLQLLAQSLAGAGKGYLNFQADRQRAQQIAQEQALRDKTLQAQMDNYKSEAAARDSAAQLAKIKADNDTTALNQADTKMKIGNLMKVPTDVNVGDQPDIMKMIQEIQLAPLFKQTQGGTTLTPGAQMPLPGAVNLQGQPTFAETPASTVQMQAPGTFRLPDDTEKKVIAKDQLDTLNKSIVDRYLTKAQTNPLTEGEKNAFGVAAGKPWVNNPAEPYHAPIAGKDATGPGFFKQTPSGLERVPGAAPIPPASAASGAPSPNAKNVADGIEAGITPPTMLTGMGYSKEKADLIGELSKRGINSSKLVTEWAGAQRAVQTLNGAQQIRLTQAINKALPSLDLIDELSTRLSASMPRSAQFPIFNRAAMASAINGGPGWSKEAQSDAMLLDQQIADVTGELATVIMGGYAPTDKGLALAGKNLQGDWTDKMLHDATMNARRNLNFASQAQQNTRPQGTNENIYADQVGMGNLAGGAGNTHGADATNATTVKMKEQGGHTFKVTYDAKGNVISSEFVK